MILQTRQNKNKTAKKYSNPVRRSWRRWCTPRMEVVLLGNPLLKDRQKCIPSSHIILSPFNALLFPGLKTNSESPQTTYWEDVPGPWSATCAVHCFWCHRVRLQCHWRKYLITTISDTKLLSKTVVAFIIASHKLYDTPQDRRSLLSCVQDAIPDFLPGGDGRHPCTDK